MSLTIYGTSASRAARPLWVAEELQLTYAHSPVVVDYGAVVWESMACALYLAAQFRPDGVARWEPLPRWHMPICCTEVFGQ